MRSELSSAAQTWTLSSRASTRARFEELCQDLFRSTIEPVEKVLKDSKTDKVHVHEIVLVGGSTHMPRIQTEARQ